MGDGTNFGPWYRVHPPGTDLTAFTDQFRENASVEAAVEEVDGLGTGARLVTVDPQGRHPIVTLLVGLPDGRLLEVSAITESINDPGHEQREPALLRELASITDPLTG